MVIFVWFSNLFRLKVSNWKGGGMMCLLTWHTSNFILGATPLVIDIIRLNLFWWVNNYHNFSCITWRKKTATEPPIQLNMIIIAARIFFYYNHPSQKHFLTQLLIISRRSLGWATEFSKGAGILLCFNINEYNYCSWFRFIIVFMSVSN